MRSGQSNNNNVVTKAPVKLNDLSLKGGQRNNRKKPDFNAAVGSGATSPSRQLKPVPGGLKTLENKSNFILTRKGTRIGVHKTIEQPGGDTAEANGDGGPL